jgi:GNAT superfamily N-acetyltransferase
MTGITLDHSMISQEFRRENFLLSTDKELISIDTVCGFLGRSHWAANRKRETIIKSIEHSLCYGIYDKVGDRQVAFARLVTDYSTYAYLCDVYVDEDYRGRGLSKWMMDCIMKNPDLSTLRRFTLATKDAHTLYEKFGFAGLSQEENRRFMSILKENV